MANPLARAIAVVRGNPAIAIAVGGVGAAAAVTVLRRPAEPPPVEGAVDNSALAPIGGYGAGLTQPLPGPAYDYSDESARGNAAIVNALAANQSAIVKAIEAQAARSVTLPTTPAAAKPKAAASLTGDLGTIIIGLRNQYKAWYQDWLRYAGAAGKQRPGETPAQRTARLRRELDYYTARLSGRKP